MKKNTHGNNKWQRKICSQRWKKVETNSKRRKQLAIFRTYLIRSERMKVMKSVLHYGKYLLLGVRASERNSFRFVCVSVYIYVYIYACICFGVCVQFVVCTVQNSRTAEPNRAKQTKSSGDDDSSCSIENKQPSKRRHIETRRETEKQRNSKWRTKTSYKITHYVHVSMYWSLFIRSVLWKLTECSEI